MYKGQYLTCEAPSDIRNSHDDFPDSFALMLWCMHEDAMPYVETTNENIFRGGDKGGPGNRVPFSLR